MSDPEIDLRFDNLLNIKRDKEYQTNVRLKNHFLKELDGWDNLQDAFVEQKAFDRYHSWVDYPNDPFIPNKDLFRCDNFSKLHNGKHLLFSGCSVTYGQGLYVSETWSKKLYDLIKEKDQVSGYYNIGTPGRSVQDIVSSVFKYCNTYGNPDIIFIDLPDLDRLYLLDEKVNDATASCNTENINFLLDNGRHGAYHGKGNRHMAELRYYVYQYLMMLEVYCKSNNIQLYVFSYANGTSSFFKKCDLDNFYILDENKIKKEIHSYVSDNKDDEFSLVARDKEHLGTAFHEAWSKVLFELYCDKNDQ